MSPDVVTAANYHLPTYLPTYVHIHIPTTCNTLESCTAEPLTQEISDKIQTVDVLDSLPVYELIQSVLIHNAY